MTKSSLEMKKLIEEFIKITNVKYEDQTEKIKEKKKIRNVNCTTGGGRW